MGMPVSGGNTLSVGANPLTRARSAILLDQELLPRPVADKLIMPGYPRWQEGSGPDRGQTRNPQRHDPAPAALDPLIDANDIRKAEDLRAGEIWYPPGGPAAREFGE